MKDLEISKELIKTVLQKESETLSKDFNFTINEDYIEFSDDGEMLFEYCIYKFSFKCKEWAYYRGFCIHSGYSKNSINLHIAELNGWVCETLEFERIFNSNSEIEAIIKSCEWVYYYLQINETRTK